MADTKTSLLTALTGANLVVGDIFPVADISVPETKGITVQELLTGILGSVSKTGLTETTSKPLLNLVQTWNAAGVTFTGLKFNAISTASAAASLLMDLQLDSVSTIQFPKRGAILFPVSSVVNPAQVGVGNWAGTVGFFTTAGIVATLSSTVFNFSSTAAAFTINADVILSRGGAAATWQFGAADAASPIAQTLLAQSVVTGTSNVAGADLTIGGSKSTGSGAGGRIIFKTSPVGGSGTAVNALVNAWAIGTTQTLHPLVTLATTMTTGFLNIPGAAGAPTGVPGNTTGFPLYWNSATNQLSVYDGGWLTLVTAFT